MIFNKLGTEDPHSELFEDLMLLDTGQQKHRHYIKHKLNFITFSTTVHCRKTDKRYKKHISLMFKSFNLKHF
jgi:hypothetical protein